MKTVFKKNDRVYDIEYGWGTVVDIEVSQRCAIIVEFDCKAKHSYLFDGKYPPGGGYPRMVLSFTEYTLSGFSQERPEELPKKGDIVWVRMEFPARWIVGHFFEKEDDRYHISCDNKNRHAYGYEIRTTNPYEDEQ